MTRPIGKASGPPPSAPPLPRHKAPSGGKRGRPRGPFTQHRRLDALRSLLQRHPKGLTIYDLARELGVTPRSLRRYLVEVKRELDLVCDTAERPGGALLWRLAASELPRKIEVRRTQAYALLAARRVFEPLRGSTLFEEIDLATRKLAAVARRPGRGPNAGVADARLEDRFLYLPFAPKDYEAKAAELDDLFHAVADLRPLRCRYQKRDGTEEPVTLLPYAMVLYKDAIYCVARSESKGEIRTYLLDRMRDTECLTGQRFALPADFRVDDYFQGNFGIYRGHAAQRVVVDFDAGVAEFVRTRRVHPSQALEARPDGGVRLTMQLGDLSELATWILGFGRTARVVEPPELVLRVREELAGALALYAASAEAAPPPLAKRARRGAAEA